MFHQHQIENFVNSSRTRNVILSCEPTDGSHQNVIIFCKPDDCFYRNVFLSLEPHFRMNPLTVTRTRWRRVRYVVSISIYIHVYRLNVGGRIFEVSWKLLLEIPSSRNIHNSQLEQRTINQKRFTSERNISKIYETIDFCTPLHKEGYSSEKKCKRLIFWR